MLYRDEKLKQIINQQIKNVWQTAAASRERTCWLGGLATLAWIACIIHLPPILKTRNYAPHIIAVCAAYSIAGTVKENLKKASNTQRSVIEATKRLKTAQTSEELHQIRRERDHLENLFIIKSGREKE